ncbi:MAG: hypothetical protein PF637_07075 [Spirochaetes bacterium]|jgi:hypothetical protein|nr:hypothetical protein [Spirochaetota bacterium]
MAKKYYISALCVAILLIVAYQLGTTEICYQSCAEVNGKSECVNNCSTLYQIISRNCTITPTDGTISDEAALGELVNPRFLPTIKKIFR